MAYLSFRLVAPNTPFRLLSAKLNIAIRIGVEQACKLRDCDDIRYTMTNLACVVETPIKLAPWGQFAEMCRPIQSSQRDWKLLKADDEAAY